MLLEVIKHYSRQKIHFTRRGMGSVLSNLTIFFFLWNVQVNNENKKIKDTLIVTTNKITKPIITMPKLQNLSYYKPKYCLKNFRFFQLSSNNTLQNMFLICSVNIYIYIYIFLEYSNIISSIYCYFSYLIIFCWTFGLERVKSHMRYQLKIK